MAGASEGASGLGFGLRVVIFRQIAGKEPNDSLYSKRRNNYGARALSVSALSAAIDL